MRFGQPPTAGGNRRRRAHWVSCALVCTVGAVPRRHREQRAGPAGRRIRHLLSHSAGRHRDATRRNAACVALLALCRRRRGVGATSRSVYCSASLSYPIPPHKAHRPFSSGVALSITAVAVAGRVLNDFGLLHHPVGRTIIAAAVFDDILGLILLAVLTAVIATGAVPPVADLAFLVVKVGVFFAATIGGSRYFYPWAMRVLGAAHSRAAGFTALLVVAFAFAVLAELMGMHFIMGAFVAGLFFEKRLVGRAGLRGHSRWHGGVHLWAPGASVFCRDRSSHRPVGVVARAGVPGHPDRRRDCGKVGRRRRCRASLGHAAARFNRRWNRDVGARRGRKSSLPASRCKPGFLPRAKTAPTSPTYFRPSSSRRSSPQSPHRSCCGWSFGRREAWATPSPKAKENPARRPGFPVSQTGLG